MRLAILSVAWLVAGCAAMQIEDEYKGAEQIPVPVGIKRTQIKSLVVRFHPTDAHRASVTAGDGMLTEALVGSQWDARIDEFKMAYQAALLHQLAQRGRACVVTEAYPYPDTFTFDFLYACK